MLATFRKFWKSVINAVAKLFSSRSRRSIKSIEEREIERWGPL